jgi:type IV pilus secretin PilQ/predicted competence protein
VIAVREHGVRVEGEMVKVGSMTRAKRILLIAGVVLLGVSAADARPWARKAAKPAEASPVAAIALTAVDVEESRIILRTSGAPAYTSYSAAPGVFVIDLAGATRAAGLTTPASFPAGITSISAEDVVEMGTALTRVTLRLSDSLRPEISAIENAVVVALPEPRPAARRVAEVPVTPSPDTYQEPVVTEVPVMEFAAAEPPARHSEPAVPLRPAKSVKRIDASHVGGSVEVRITGDGELRYKAFRLEGPPRLVIDLDGVRNAAPRSSVPVDDPVVQRVRVAQFQPNVARVVVDLAHKTDYDIAVVGEQVRVAFGSAVAVSREPVRTPPPAPKPAAPVQAAEIRSPPVQTAEVRPEPVRETRVTADIPSQVPAIAENTTWRMPEPASQGARAVINAPQQQVPAQRIPIQEDIFAEPTVRSTPQTLSGTRTLSGAPRVFTGELISLALKDADIRDVLATFAAITGLNIAIDPGVTGSVTVDFVDVPWDQALDLILRMNGLTYSLEGNVMRIGTVDRIAAEAAATRRLADEERLNVPLDTVSFKLSYARAQEVQALLRDIASPRARIIVDQRTNQLIVSEIPQFLRTMQNLIDTIDIPTRQVMIEARIVESSRTFAQQWGFEWGFGGDLDPALGTGTGLVFPNRIGFTGGPFEFGSGGNSILSLSFTDVLGTFNLDLALLAAESQGFIKVVSAPRVTTQDNMAAEIQSGFQIPYQTRVNFTTTVTYLDATLRLSVTPQITEAGTVIMEIAVQKNEPATGLAIEGAAGTPLTTRQARTRLMVRDGGTAVIAGIFQTRDNRSESRVPFVHNIPVFGALFRSHNISTSHDELLIFITPRIVRG